MEAVRDEMEDAMMQKGNGVRRAGALVISVATLLGALALGASTPALAVAQPATGLSAFINGTELHVHALQIPPKIADADEAFSVSAIDSSGFVKDKKLVNEVNEGIIPTAGKNVFARGGGVEVGLGENVPNDAADRIALTTAQSSAPTAAPPYTNGLLPNVQNTIDLAGALDPLVNASVLGGRAATLWNPNYLFPTLGNPLPYAYGQAADAQALNLASNPSLDALGRFVSPVLSTNSDPNGPDRSVASAQSFSYLVNNGDGTCGLAAEVHMSIAPVNIAAGNLLIEVGGDWLMKAVATGKSTGNSFTYGPDPAANAPNTPLIRVVDTSTGDVLGQLTTQDLLGNEGLSLPANPLIDLSIGEHARKIAPPKADGSETDPDPSSAATHNSTLVSAAADVVRLRLLSGVAAPFQAADLRLGHFEMKMNVPTGGVNCEIPVSKTASVPVANNAQPMTFMVKVPTSPLAVAPFPCDLTGVVVTDVMTVQHADTPAKPPKMKIVGGTGPKGVTGTPAADGQSIAFPAAGPWTPGGPSLVYTIRAIVAADSGTGIMKDTATAVASAANCSGKKSVLGPVIGLITGDATGVGNGKVTGSVNFFG
ncbi:MAG: hypothetical protein E6G68_03655, partial [Actinobacteria bacterium]